MGPWMRLTEMYAKRRGSTRHIQKVMGEMKKREQKRMMEARIKKEEGLKLKAARAFRFGRFAIRVPFTNIIRYRDQALSAESYADQAQMNRFVENISTRSMSTRSVSNYIPGQHHQGVMIPELNIPRLRHRTSVRFAQGNRVEDVFSSQQHYQHQVNHDDFENDLSYPSTNSSSNSTQLSPPFKIGSIEDSFLFAVEMKESTDVNSQGFEVVPLSQFKNSYNNNETHADRGESRNEEETWCRDGEEIRIECPSPMRSDDVSVKQMQHVLSDLTDNW